MTFVGDDAGQAGQSSLLLRGFMFGNTTFCSHESAGRRRITREVRGNGARRLNLENIIGSVQSQGHEPAPSVQSTGDHW